MKQLFLMVCCLGCAMLVRAQTLTILDKQTLQPIEGVVLHSDTPEAMAITNARGQADLAVFQQASAITIRYLGYQTEVASSAALQSNGATLLLQSTNINLNEVVVAATRWQQPQYNVPAKVTAIRADEIALQNPQTAADLLGISGKVFIQKSQQGGGSPMIRGFATNRLIYVVDGVRMNNAIFRGGNLQNVINLDPFATEKVEVLFGPASVMYGSDAIGGVMSFQTLTPRLSDADGAELHGNVLVRHATANKERTGHLDLHLGGKKWAWVGSASAWDFDHLRQGSHGPADYIKDVYPQRQGSSDAIITQDDPLLQIPSAYSQVNLMQKLRFSPNDKWDIQYGFHHSATSSYGRYDRHTRFRNGLPRYAEWDYGPQRWTMNNLSLAYNNRHALYNKVAVRLSQQAFEESRIDRNLNSNTRNTTAEKVKAYALNVDFAKIADSKNALYYGVEYVYNDVESTGFTTDIQSGQSVVGPSRYPISSWYSAAAYSNVVHRASEVLTLQGGLRYNYYGLDADFSNNLDFYPFPYQEAQLGKGALTGSFGSVIRINNDWTVQASLGTAFRSPNVDDIGKVFDSAPGAVTVPNPDLKAEYAYNADLGLVKIWSEKVKLDVGAYYTVLQNALVRRHFQLNGQDSILYEGMLSEVQALQNAAQARVYGVQVGLDVVLLRHLTFATNINIQKGEEELDDGSTSPSRHAAPLFGVGRLRYQSKGLTLEMNVTFQGEKSFEDLPEEERAKTEIYAKDANGNNYAPAWYTLNVKTKYQLSKLLAINAGLENITDQRYRPYSSGISGAGRNLVLSLSLRF